MGKKTWEVSTIAGGKLAGSDASGVYKIDTSAEAQFQHPVNITVDVFGNVYVTDFSNHCIRKITPEGNISILVNGTVPGYTPRELALQEEYRVSPFGGTVQKYPRYFDIAVDIFGNVYVADTENHLIKKITSDGEISTLAGSTYGYKNATGKAARFSDPMGVAVDSSSNVYVADTGNNRIRKITPEGKVTLFAGSSRGSDDGTGINAQFNNPTGVAVDLSDNVYVADTYNQSIRKITPGREVSTFAGGTRVYYPGGEVNTLAGGTQGYYDGTGILTQFNNPTGVAVDSSSNIYVADTHNHRIREITSEGVVTTLAGSGTRGHQDATGTVAQFRYPYGVAVDSSSNVYVADLGNHSIRKIEYK